MPGWFRHPPFRKLDRLWLAGQWTPEQVRGDGVTLEAVATMINVDAVIRPFTVTLAIDRAATLWTANRDWATLSLDLDIRLFR